MARKKVKRNSKWFFFIALLSVASFVTASTIFLWKQNYVRCLSVDVITCMKSSSYESPNKLVSFRYPADYPLSFKTGEEMITHYFFADKYLEWINFSSKFYPNAGGERLGSIILTKNTEYSSVEDFANKQKEQYDRMSSRYKGSAPKIEFLTIAGNNAVRILPGEQISNFAPPSEQYVIVKGDILYTISFTFNDYYHKQTSEYYNKAKRVILSTLSLPEH